MCCPDLYITVTIGLDSSDVLIISNETEHARWRRHAIVACFLTCSDLCSQTSASYPSNGTNAISGRSSMVINLGSEQVRSSVNVPLYNGNN